MPRSGSVLCFSERRRERNQAPLVLSSEKLRADPIEARRPDLRSAAFHERLSSRGTCGPVLLDGRIARMITVAEALDIVSRACSPGRGEFVPLAESFGRVLAKPVTSDV